MTREVFVIQYLDGYAFIESGKIVFVPVQWDVMVPSKGRFDAGVEIVDDALSLSTVFISIL